MAINRLEWTSPLNRYAALETRVWKYISTFTQVNWSPKKLRLQPKYVLLKEYINGWSIKVVTQRIYWES